MVSLHLARASRVNDGKRSNEAAAAAAAAASTVDAAFSLAVSVGFYEDVILHPLCICQG